MSKKNNKDNKKAINKQLEAITAQNPVVQLRSKYEQFSDETTDEKDIKAESNAETKAEINPSKPETSAELTGTESEVIADETIKTESNVVKNDEEVAELSSPASSQTEKDEQPIEATLNEMMDFTEKEQVFRGFYLDNDIVQVIDALADRKKKSKGFKSEFVNNILRSVFEQYDLFKIIKKKPQKRK